MKYYFFKLVPPRSTFPGDITPAEAQLMQEHSTYWKSHMSQGNVVAFGPVFDPKGPFGIGIIRLEEGEHASNMCANDPTILANVGFAYEVYPMPNVVLPE
jgi:hypothetical protein